MGKGKGGGGGGNKGGGSKPSGGGGGGTPSGGNRTPSGGGNRTPSGGGNRTPSGGGSNKKSPSELAAKARTLISSGQGGSDQFKNILQKLKAQGKDKRVDRLRSLKKQFGSQAVTPSGPTDNLSGSGVPHEDGYTPFDPSDLESQLADLYGRLEELQLPKEEFGENVGGAYQGISSSTDIEGEFDPALFRNLLGELESSKRRQKEWNEQSAKAAYKY